MPLFNNHRLTEVFALRGFHSIKESVKETLMSCLKASIRVNFPLAISMNPHFFAEMDRTVHVPTHTETQFIQLQLKNWNCFHIFLKMHTSNLSQQHRLPTKLLMFTQELFPESRHCHWFGFVNTILMKISNAFALFTWQHWGFDHRYDTIISLTNRWMNAIVRMAGGMT